MEDIRLCDFGCGQAALIQLKNGKWCCSTNAAKCPESRRKHSLRLKQTYLDGRVSSFKSHVAWNKGLTKETDARIKQYSDTFHQRIVDGTIIPYMRGKRHSIETKMKIAQKATGYNKGAGQGKHGWYKEYWCDSSWELAWVISNLEHGIQFTRNTEGFEYEFGGVKRKYYPDFKLEDGSYVEIKGFLDAKSKAKKDSFGGILIILGYKEMAPYIEYAKEKYGRDFISLYKGYTKPEKKLVPCPSCGKEYSGCGKVCVDCSLLSRRKVERPSKEVLTELTRTTSMVKIGKMYGVSGAAVKKWCFSYEITKA